MLHDPSVRGESKDVDAGPDVIAGPFLAAMKHYIVTFGDDPLEFNALARILARGLFKVVDEALLAVRNTGIVLYVLISGVAFNRLTWAALVEHEVVESDHILLVPFQVVHRIPLLPLARRLVARQITIGL